MGKKLLSGWSGTSSFEDLLVRVGGKQPLPECPRAAVRGAGLNRGLSRKLARSTHGRESPVRVCHSTVTKSAPGLGNSGAPPSQDECLEGRKRVVSGKFEFGTNYSN